MLCLLLFPCNNRKNLQNTNIGILIVSSRKQGLMAMVQKPEDADNKFITSVSLIFMDLANSLEYII